MGIEKLKGSLLSEAGDDARKILAESEAQAKGMMGEVRERSAQLKKDTEKEIESTLQEQRNERIAWARLESRRILAEAREDAIKGVLEEFFDGLGNVRRTAEYRKFMSGAVAAAAEELGSGSTVHVLKGDKALLSLPKGAKAAEDLEGLGGAMVESADGKIRIDLTLETLFEGKRDDVRKSIHESLFGGK